MPRTIARMKPTNLARLARLGISMFSGAAFASCAQTPAPRLAESVRLATELRALVGDARCQTDQQCRSLAVGHKACGGPSGYLAWSVIGTDVDKLTELAARQARAERVEQETIGILSDCAVVMDPGAFCGVGRCQLVKPRDAAAVSR